MWAFESVFYQIYPLGFCGAPFENDGVLEHRLEGVGLDTSYEGAWSGRGVFFAAV